MDVASPILWMCFLLAVAAGIPKPVVADKGRVKNDLSDEQHYAEGEHNPEYDHEAFLGEDEAKEFDQLTPEESRQRLEIIAKKIDKDGDGLVTHDELKDWIQHTQRRYVVDDTKKQWETHNPENKESLSWEGYRKIVYGFMDDEPGQAREEDEDDDSTYKDMEQRDKRRWEVADRNLDGMLDFGEFTDFLHPEEAEHMREIVIEETLADIDKDKDGKVSLDEYIGDMYGGTGGEEPDWVANEREQFKEFRDKDGDGFLDKDEVMAWILPPEYDHSEAEARHLVTESDRDGDDKLSVDEILDKYDLFVGSQATDFGEALVRHDEF